MRTEQEMFDLILSTARDDERIRAVVLNGSRANPNAPRDFFQDFDIVYFVTEVGAFKADPHWIDRFGERMVMQLPDDFLDPPPTAADSYCYLLQFSDGNRLDLTLYPLAKLAAQEKDSQTVVLLDKDGILPAFPPTSDRDYLPQPPTPKAYFECCNEFWWVCPYVAKGLWRQEFTYARAMLDEAVRDQLMAMLSWYLGVQTQFTVSPGKLGKYLEKYLEPELWELLLQTYACGDSAHTWQALFALCHLFRRTAIPVAEHFGYAYPFQDDARVSAHLEHVQSLPRDAEEMY